jgi:uncharacterized lipoprotein YmbA
MNFASLTRLPLLVAAFTLSQASCAGSPDPVFYALSSQNGSKLQSPALRIEMRRVGLPGYLDRPHIVRRASAERLELAADERWGAPLDAMVSATLGDDLAGRLPNCVVFSESGSISTTADVRVEVEITRFELDADGAVHLQAGSAVRWSTGTDAVRLKRHEVTVQPSSKSTADLIAGMSRALGQLADAIAHTILEGTPAPVTEPAAPTGL